MDPKAAITMRHSKAFHRRNKSTVFPLRDLNSAGLKIKKEKKIGGNIQTSCFHLCSNICIDHLALHCRLCSKAHGLRVTSF